MADDPDEERVGYGRPPKEHRFKAGQSGNPKGRPRGARGLKTVVPEVLNRRMPVTMNGRRRTISKLEAVLERMVQRAVGDGDMRAIDSMLRLAQQYDREPVGPVSEVEPDDQAIIARHVERLRGRDD